LFAEALAAGNGREQPVLVLELSRVEFLDSTALGTMVGALRRVREAGGEMRVVLPETTARRIFEVTGLDQVLDVYATKSDALGA
jgi:anti-sigma B factor antagonist